MNAFDEAMGAIFADSNFGQQAQYLAPGAVTPIPCAIILSRADRELGDFQRSNLHREGTIGEVRAREIANLEKGGIFTLADGSVRRILDDPITKDPDRLIWTFTLKS